MAAQQALNAGAAAVIRRLGMLVALTVLAVPIARAGGGDEDATGDAATEGPSYYGFIWDTRGATVTLRGKAGKPAEQKSNLMGMYRTHINKDVKPAEVVMTCAKEGYRQARVVRRNLPDASAARVQIDCVLQKG